MKRIAQRWLFLFVFSLFCQGATASQPLLKSGDVRKSMEGMFHYHVEYKELLPLLVKRSFKVYIDQFDMEKMYLLQSEVQPFLELTEGQVARIVNNYQRDDLSEFISLNQTLQRAVVRARTWREEIERQLILNATSSDRSSAESYLQFAITEDQLKERIRAQLVRFLYAEKRAGQPWTPEVRAKIFSLWERRFQRVENSYMDSKTRGEAEHNLSMHILKAMARSLDAHTAYFSPDEAAEMRASLEKQFEGVGVILREGIEGIEVVDLIKGGPAQKSGKIQVGDLLVEIDGTSLSGMAYDEVLALMKGNGRKELNLGLKRTPPKGEQELVRVALIREKITLQEERVQYTSEPHADGIIGKINLPSFYESGLDSGCEKDMREAIKELKKGPKLLGLIIDMRENSGGFLNQAVKVAGLFITRGVVVISKYAQGEVKYLRDIDGRIYFNGPLLILTSKASASAAEIVAQALQDYGTALIVGDERTYGKGTIQYQTVTDEEAKAFFKVTVGRYYTVSGRSTQIEGVQANIVVPTEFSFYNIGERFLQYPLTSDQISAAYIDPLTDIDQINRAWFQKNYLPYVQKQELLWQRLLPSLVQNSSYRLKRDPNFALFLDGMQRTKEGNSKEKTNWGVEDLQMGEAVAIMKDMILLEKQKASLLQR